MSDLLVCCLIMTPGLLFGVLMTVAYIKAVRDDRKAREASEAFSEDLRRHQYMRG